MVQARFDKMRNGANSLRQPGNEIRATLGEAPNRRDARTGLFTEPATRPGVCLTHPSGGSGKGHRQWPGQDSNQFPDIPPLKDITITISVIDGPSKGLVFEMKERCITLGRTGGGADFQFNEPEASEIQCVVATRQNGVCLYDAVSVYGTYVNGQRIAAAELTDMSTFRVGSSLMLIKVQSHYPADIC